MVGKRLHQPTAIARGLLVSRGLWWLLPLVLPGAGLRAQELFLEKQGGGVYERSVVISPAEFLPAQVERLSREFVQAHRGQFKMMKLSILTDKVDAARAGMGKPATDITYEGWLDLYNREGRNPQPMAETIVIGDCAVMRVRDAQGRVRRTILEAQDPLILEAGGVVFEILHVAFSPIPETRRSSPDESFDTSFFVRTTGPVNQQQARRLTKLLVKRLGIAAVSVELRRDAWFIEHEDFPIAYRFESTSAPPTHGEHRRSCEAGCSFESNRIRCTDEGLPPEMRGHCETPSPPTGSKHGESGQTGTAKTP